MFSGDDHPVYVLRVWSIAKDKFTLFTKYGALVAKILKFTVFWDVTSYGLVVLY
jgi:hypothetical protein